MTGVIINLCQQLHLCGALAFENGVIHNKCVPPIFGSQRFDGVGNNPGGKQSGKALPVNMGRIFQAIHRVFPKSRCFLRLHIQKHAPVSEDKAEQILDQRSNRNALLFVSVALLQNAADLISFEKNLDSGRKTLFIFDIKCYTVHSADPLYVFGVLW